jgi:hypothetical protein
MSEWQPEATAPRDGSWIVSSGKYPRRLRWARTEIFQFGAVWGMWSWTDEEGRYCFHVNEWKPADEP